MDIQKQHEDFCKVFKPEFGTIFNIDSVQFEPLEHKYYQDAQRLNWAFAGWLQAAKAQAVPENKQFNLDEFLAMEEKLKHKGGVITADLDRFIAYAEMVLEKAKAQSVADGFVVVPKRPTRKMMIAASGWDQPHLIYKAMIEAQEPK